MEKWKESHDIPLAKSILPSIDDFRDRRLQPIIGSRKRLIVCVSPLDRVVQQFDVRINAGICNELLDNELCKWTISRRCVQSCLRDGCGFRAHDLFMLLDFRNEIQEKPRLTMR